MALALMAEHGLHDWRLVIDSAKTRAGVCRFARREIGLSRHLTVLHSEAEVRDTVLHEIAHALVGPEHRHDAVWRATAVRLGCSGERCVPRSAPRVAGDWVGVCPAGHTTTMHRSPQRVRSCRQCAGSFALEHLITWTYRGRTVPMHPRYVAELARLTGAGSARRAGLGSSDGSDGVRGSGGAGRSARHAPSGGSRQPALAAAAMPVVGDLVRLRAPGRYDGQVGTVERRGRTRFRVRLDTVVVTAPFSMVERV
jgi:predicted SprT family Zn-dependent metalloprotease